MKCEVEGCQNQHTMTLNMPKRFIGTKRICQSHWLKIMKANKEDTEQLPFRFKEPLPKGPKKKGYLFGHYVGTFDIRPETWTR